MKLHSIINVFSVCGHLVSRLKVWWEDLLLQSKCLCTTQAGAALVGRCLAVHMRNLAPRAALILSVDVSTTFEELASGGMATSVMDLNMGTVVQIVGLRNWDI
jgi:hypothetical protein